MKKLLILLMLVPTSGVLLLISKADAANDESEIQQLLDKWPKAARAHDVNSVMSIYAPEVIAYDIVPPLRFVGAEAYRKVYKEFFAQYDGPIDVEYRDLKIVVGGDVAFAYGLERLSGTLKNGEKSDIWVRFTSGFRKINGKWFDVHDHLSVLADLETGKADRAVPKTF
jgi:uncharacterized protein (TIGR02246 family)